MPTHETFVRQRHNARDTHACVTWPAHVISAMAADSIQTLRLRKPDAVKTPAKVRHTGVLQDQLRRSDVLPTFISIDFSSQIIQDS